MSSTVIAKMNTCNKVNKVTAKMQEDGTIQIEIVSDCPNVKAYAEKLKTITMEDATNYNGSKVVDPDIRATLSVPCLTPIAVFDAAWMELGMLSKSRAKNVKTNDISFENCNE
ncbi:MAG: hypothetical protein KRP56_02235 [Candidatus Methanogranum gryphiswaldense]|jgi:hypothetical protein|nr:MAG: hypothetical protein KRP56_02235 [Candidatus Methanogranum sp. U3.2.1]